MRLWIWNYLTTTLTFLAQTSVCYRRTLTKGVPNLKGIIEEAPTGFAGIY